MSEQDDIQGSKTPRDENPQTRNKETFYLLCLLVFIWILPYLTALEFSGVAIFGYMFLIGLSIIGALILFLPFRWLAQLCLDGQRKTPPRIAVIVIFTAVITYMVINITPQYVKNVKHEANEYYTENSQEFADPYEGKIIRIAGPQGAHDKYFIYTYNNPPLQGRGCVIINYKNGWYFSGTFIPY